MRFFSLFLSVFILIICAFSAQSAERELPDFERIQINQGNHDRPPARDLGPDWIFYDDGEGGGLIAGATPYWSKVTFTVEEDFQLQGFCVTILNQEPNREEDCWVRVYSEDLEHNLGGILMEINLAEVNGFGREPEHVIEFDEQDFIDFEAGENFTIMYESPSNQFGNNGWWNLYDENNDAFRSFYCLVDEFGDEPSMVHADWRQLNGDLLLRANGEFQRPRELNIAFRDNWNMISINVFPPEEMYAENEDRGPDVVLMTEQLRRENGEHRLEIIKDDRGRFYIPAWNFSNIPYWNLTRGYQVRVTEDFETVWTGLPIPFDMDIPMEEGWHIIAYLPTFQLDASAPDFYVLSPIIEDVFIACDWAGRFMAPGFNFSNMIPWEEGQGYQIRVNNDVVLNYPPEQEEEIAGTAISLRNKHWNIKPSDERMSVLITSVIGIEVISGDQIGAFDHAGNIVGVGDVDPDGRCGIAVWGDDMATEIKDGLLQGEAFSIRLWSSDNEAEVEIDVTTVSEGSGLIYETDGFTVISAMGKPSIPDQYFLSQNYPNPFNSTTTLSFNVPKISQISIVISDIGGRHIKTLVNQEIEAGNHITTWNTDDNPNGIYVARMVAQGFEVTRKLLLVK